MSSQSVSAIIVTYNSASEIRSCLDRLICGCSDLVSDIVVVDNASTDDTCALVSQYVGVRLLRSTQNKGFATAVNSGIAHTTGEDLLVMNPDVSITAEAIMAMAEGLREHSKYAALGCKLVDRNGRPQASARRFPTIASFLGRVILTNNVARALGISYEIGRWPERLVDDDGIDQVDWVLGGCMLIRRRAYEAIGPFDEGYFLYYEDIDWCYRARLKNWKIGFTSNASAIHAHKRSSSHISLGNRLTRIHFLSACRFFTKFAAERGLRTVF